MCDLAHHELFLSIQDEFFDPDHGKRDETAISSPKNRV